jgi:hypothetical protein
LYAIILGHNCNHNVDCSLNKFSAWIFCLEHVGAKGKSISNCFSTFFILLAASGWVYVALRKKFFGIVHSILMLITAGLGIGSGVLVYLHRWHIGGGSGPDANPVAPLIFLTALIATVGGVVAAICAIGIIRRLCAAKQKNV